MHKNVDSDTALFAMITTQFSFQSPLDFKGLTFYSLILYISTPIEYEEFVAPHHLSVTNPFFVPNL